MFPRSTLPNDDWNPPSIISPYGFFTFGYAIIVFGMFEGSMPPNPKNFETSFGS